MNFFIFLIFLFLHSAFAKSEMIECTVDGHGPYDMTMERCHELAVKQVETNCVLQKKNILLKYFAEKKSKKIFEGKCSVTYEAKKCSKSKCSKDS